MAYSSTLAEWLLEQREKIDFSVKEYMWVEDFAPQYHDFGVILPDGIVGRGMDKNAELALTKAIAEAIERSACLYNGLTRSAGVAAHADKDSAYQNARRELIERIAFDVHFKRRSSLKRTEPLTVEALRAAADFSSLKIPISFYSMISPSGLHAICATASGELFPRPFGAMFGFGCHEDRARAEHSALFEVLRNAAFYTKDQEITALSIHEFRKIDSPKAFDRLRLALDLNYFREIDFLFSNSVSNEAFPEITFESRELEKPPEFSAAPISIVQVTSDYQFVSYGQLGTSSLPSILD